MSRFETRARTVLFAALIAALPTFAQSAEVKRDVIGNRTSENIPEILAALLDPRVPWTEAEQIVKAVRGNGQPVWYLLYADEGHGFAKKANSDWFAAATILFWQQNLLND